MFVKTGDGKIDTVIKESELNEDSKKQVKKVILETTQNTLTKKDVKNQDG